MVAFLQCGTSGTGKSTTSQSSQRILSLAPSITETLFALGVGERVVGVTDFCTYPPQVKTLPKVGGYVDPRYEAILRLQPDIAFLLREHEALKNFLSAHQIRYVEIDNHNLSGIILSFEIIGSACGKGDEGTALADSLRRALVNAQVLTGPRPRVLLCVGRDNAGMGGITSGFAAGPATFYDQILTAAGAENVLKDSVPTYPSFSGEAVVRLDPDIIIDFMPSMGTLPASVVQKDWNSLKMVKAVKNSAVYCLEGDYTTIPGPRIGLLIDDFARMVEGFRKGNEALP